MRTLARVTLIVLPLVALAARIQGHTFGSPQMMAKEIARCLSVVRMAAARRGGPSSARAVRHASVSGDPPPRVPSV